jgi:aryl-alcohol dehydrogenase-like predicted oxidoreductase
MSNYEVADIKQCHEQRRVDAIETGLNLIDYLGDRSLIRACGDLGIGVTIYEPVAGGLLTGKTLAELRAHWTGVWLESAWYQQTLAPGKGERSIAVADGLRPIADRLGATVAQAAIAWVLHQPGVTAAIVGSRDGRHMRDNAVAAEHDLGSVLDEIEALIPLGPTFG